MTIVETGEPSKRRAALREREEVDEPVTGNAAAVRQRERRGPIGLREHEVVGTVTHLEVHGAEGPDIRRRPVAHRDVPRAVLIQPRER